MSRDRHERRHRRTASHPEVVAMMAKADFESLPSLAEAMGLEPDPSQPHQEETIPQQDEASLA